MTYIFIYIYILFYCWFLQNLYIVFNVLIKSCYDNE